MPVAKQLLGSADSRNSLSHCCSGLNAQQDDARWQVLHSRSHVSEVRRETYLGIRSISLASRESLATHPCYVVMKREKRKKRAIETGKIILNARCISLDRPTKSSRARMRKYFVTDFGY